MKAEIRIDTAPSFMDEVLEEDRKYWVARATATNATRPNLEGFHIRVFYTPEDALKRSDKLFAKGCHLGDTALAMEPLSKLLAECRQFNRPGVRICKYEGNELVVVMEVKA